MVRTDGVMPLEPGGRRTHCVRCGTCCMKGGPTLHTDDAALFEKGVLKRNELYTLRRGEVVRNIDETLMTLEQEMIKIKGQDKAWTCVFYDDDQKGCRIYEHRPMECRALKCWDLRELNEVMGMPRLQRKHLIHSDDGILKIIGAHERRCSYAILEASVKGLQEPDAEEGVEKILDLLHYDDHMRLVLIEKLGLNPGAMDFFFGRPLATTIRMFGLCVKQEGNTSVLVPLESHGS
jgi:Fe-S-cluster containining protein